MADSTIGVQQLSDRRVPFDLYVGAGGVRRRLADDDGECDGALGAPPAAR